jgi:hypothetical protein
MQATAIRIQTQPGKAGIVEPDAHLAPSDATPMTKK